MIEIFQNINKNDVEKAGGKGASLGEMTQANIPIPPGFVILADVFDKFLEQTDLNVEIKAVLDKINYEDVKSVDAASNKIRDLIADADFPKDIAKEVKEQFKELGAEYVAVRSSATAEDSSIASWAGELETFLNVKENNLLESVKKCWSSLFTPRAIFYRKEKGLIDSKVSVAVVIQKMINSEIAGITFTVHPVTQDKNQMIIEAGFGLGEAIVSGQITPDSYVIEKESWNSIDINIAEQKKQLVRISAGGNEWQDLPENKKEAQKLTQEQIIELAKICHDIENHYKFPCDIEWAFEKGKFYITQSRPITTLLETQGQKKTRKMKKIYNRPLPIYVAEYWYIGDSLGMKKLLDNYVYFTPLFIQKKGRGTAVYYDINDDKKSFEKLFQFFEEHPRKIKNIVKKYQNVWKEKIPRVENAKIKDLQWLFDLCAYEIFPRVPLLYHLGKQEKPELLKVAEAAKKARHWNDKILYIAGIKIFDLMKEKFPQLGDNADYITIEEAVAGKLPSEREIKKRQEMWIYLDGKLYSGKKNVQNFLSKNSIIIKENKIKENTTEIEGTGVYHGSAKGKVKTIFTYDDIEKINKGNIIVSPMTTPDMLPALKKAAAVITDEGGITCHAAIVSRELKIPCVIGTKIATQILKDGDEVEVDAKNGIIKLI